jgi:hypothetical protein
MDERASSPAYRAVANPDVIEIGVDFESDFTAVTRAFVCLLHDSARTPAVKEIENVYTVAPLREVRRLIRPKSVWPVQRDRFLENLRIRISKELRTFGNYIRRRRIELGLF